MQRFKKRIAELKNSTVEGFKKLKRALNAGEVYKAGRGTIGRRCKVIKGLKPTTK